MSPGQFGAAPPAFPLAAAGVSASLRQHWDLWAVRGE